MKILIAIPAFDERAIFTKCYESIWKMDKCGAETELYFATGYDCATARNKMAQHAMDVGADYILMVDSDTVVPEDTIRNMLDDPKDVCLGYYAHRDDNNIYSGRTNICRLYQPDGEEYFNYPGESEYTGAEMRQARESGQYKIRVHGGGMGCAFIKTDVFRTLTYPWYDWVNYADDHRGMLSEDLYFCEQLKYKRIPIYTDSRVGCGHILRHCQMPD